jgi:WD40 repeat protein/uncharacterized caspase-like protein
MEMQSNKPHTLINSISVSIILLIVLATAVIAQSPTPTQDKRDIGLQPNQQANSQSSQGKVKEPKPELILQTGYNSFYGATRLAFSPDGRLLATATFHANAIKLWETATGRELRNLSNGGTNTSSLSPVFAWSPDSRLLAASGGNNTISIWDVTTGREVQALTGSTGSFMSAFGITFVGFSGDGRKLVIISDAVRVWDTSTWREASTIQTSNLNPGSMMGGGGGAALNADGSQLARVDNDQIKFIDPMSGKEMRSVALSDSQVQNVELAFTADGRLLAAGINDKKLKVWDVSSKSERVQAATQKEFAVIKFSSDGRLVAVCENYVVRVWDISSGKEVATITAPNTGLYQEVGGVFAAFSSDGKRLATSGFGTKTFVWDVDTGKQVQQMTGRTNMAYAVAFSEDGTQLTSGGRTLWDLRTGQGRRLSSAATEKQLGMPSPDGKLIAMFAPNTAAVTIYDATTGRTLQTLSRANFDGGVERVRFSRDGRSLAVIYTTAQGVQQIGRLPSSELKIWDAVAGREIQTLLLSTSPVETGFSSDGKMLATVTSQGEITLWNVASGSRLRSLSTSAGQTFDPMSMMKGMPTSPSQIKRGQIPNMQNLPNMDQMSSMITNMLGTMTAGTNGRNVASVTFSRDGGVLASGGIESKSNFDMASMTGQATNQKRGKNQPQPNTDDFLKQLKVETTGQLVLWNPATGQQLGMIKGHGKGITSVAFNRDAKLVASAGTDNTIKIWDVATQRELKTLAGHTAGIESMDFSPDGKLLASASEDGSTFLWDANTGEHLLTLISLDDGGEWMAVTPEGLFDGTPQSWNQILWRYNQDIFNVAPVDWFFNEYYYPGLLSEVFAGKRPKVAMEISKKDRRQPVVKLSIPGAAENISSRTVKVKLEIADAAPDQDHKQGSGARDLRLFRNGSLVKVWHGDALNGQSANSIEQELTLVAGPNRLTAYAFNNDNVKSKDANLLLTGADSLKRAGTAWVIAVGVNDYANSQYNLKYAVADAQSFAAEVTREQTPIGRFDHVEVVPLVNEQATKENILAALRRLTGSDSAPPTLKAGLLDKLKRAEPEDAVIIYFAGHGTAQGQRFYLIPHDLGYTGDRHALDEAGLKSILSHSISDQELEDAVEGIAAGSLLMVIDACNSGQALEAEEKRRGPMNSKGLAQLAYEKGMYILTAAQSYQAALEAAQLGHGLLTYALVEEGLKTAVADNEPKDGVVNAREWLDFATERVPQMQEEKMKQTRGIGIGIAFTEGEQKTDPEKRSVQRPRVFYRREMEANPLVVAKPAAQP